MNGYKAQLARGSSIPGGYSGNDNQMLMNKMNTHSRSPSLVSPVQALNSYKHSFTPNHGAVKLAPLNSFAERSTSVPRMVLPNQPFISRSNNFTERKGSMPASMAPI